MQWIGFSVIFFLQEIRYLIWEMVKKTTITGYLFCDVFISYFQIRCSGNVSVFSFYLKSFSLHPTGFLKF